MNQINIVDVIINLIFTAIGAVAGVFLQRHYDKKNRKEDQEINLQKENARKLEEANRIRQQEENDILLLENTFFMTARTLESYHSGLKNYGFNYFEKETPRMIGILKGNCKMLQERDTNNMSKQMKTRYFFAKQMIDANINNLADDVRLLENPMYSSRIDKKATMQKAISDTDKQVASFRYASEQPISFLDSLADRNKVEKSFL